MERFWDKVDKTDTCWVWTAFKRSGYGRFRLCGKLVSAHRFAYEMLVGEIPEGLQLDHLCRNRACVNPAHLEPVTQSINILRGIRKGRTTHCPQGHEYTGDNLYIYAAPDGKHRHCKTCNRIRSYARWYAERNLTGVV